MAQVHARRIPALPQGYKVLHGCNLRPRPQTPRTPRGPGRHGTLDRVKDSLSYTPGTADHPRVSDGTPTGLFIVFEGSDGSGKTTQLSLLADALTARGYTVITSREPGGTEIGEKLRDLVLSNSGDPVDARTEALIFAASRAAHAAQKIRPALAAGAVVLSDRYIDSSAAYQGAGRSLGVESIIDLSRWATSNLLPDATLFLEVPPAASEQRVSVRGTTDRIEAENTQFKARTHTAFTDLAHAETTGPHTVIDGSGTIEQVHERVLAAITPLLAQRSLPRENTAPTKEAL